MRETEGLSSEHSTPPRAPLHGPSVPLRVPAALLLTPGGAAAHQSRWPLGRSKRGSHSREKIGPEESDLDGSAVLRPKPSPSVSSSSRQGRRYRRAPARASGTSRS